MFDIDNCRSYATEANLVKALREKGIYEYRHLVVCNRRGRYTAIFPVSSCPDGNILLFSHHGFMTLG